MAHLDEGEGAPVVFLHGEPTWSFLWRKVIPPVRDAGFRCVAPDLPGFGRSDKPVDIDWYSYDRHTAFVSSLLEELDLRGATMVVHDWGGPIGLRAGDRAAASALSAWSSSTPDCSPAASAMTDAWIAFRDFVARTEDLPVGLLVRRACHRDPGDDVIAGYDAPFPSLASKAGARAFPADAAGRARCARRRRRASGCSRRCARTAARR